MTDSSKMTSASDRLRCAVRSDHFHFESVYRIPSAEFRLCCAVPRMGPGAQYDCARIGSPPRKKKPLPGSFDTRFHLRLHPRRAAVDAYINAVDSMVCPCPSPNLLRCIALECLAR